MNAREALARLRALGVPAIRTSDAAAALGQSTSAASRTLSRLAESGLVRPVRQGAWWIDGAVDPHRLPEYLTSPQPSYVSLHTALHLRGLVEQIPEIIYAASLARTQRIATSAGTVSIHHLAPEVFGGFEETDAGIKLATAEKALFDFAYLSGGRSRVFTSLPELELPRGFRRTELRRWIRRIPSKRGRTLTAERLERMLARADSGRDET
ncbi:MAG: type IV toxin-antitoxin system AbiEi family antitoxin domain-containing protein [Myxococcota bacterium]|nr:type IV toxin-antitoxin system AbiEi family antitoxin domain-containing protein [Myxococcota bacterium]